MAEVIPSSLPSSPEFDLLEAAARAPHHHARRAAAAARRRDVADSVEDDDNPAANNSCNSIYGGANLGTQRYSFSPLVVHEPVLLPSDDELDLGTQQATQRDVPPKITKFANAARVVSGGGVIYHERSVRRTATASFEPAELSTPFESNARVLTSSLGSPDLFDTPAFAAGTRRRVLTQDETAGVVDGSALPPTDQTSGFGNAKGKRARNRVSATAFAEQDGQWKRPHAPPAESVAGQDGDCADEPAVIKTKRRRLLSTRSRLNIISSQENDSAAAASVTHAEKPADVEWRRPTAAHGSAVSRDRGIRGSHGAEVRGPLPRRQDVNDSDSANNAESCQLEHGASTADRTASTPADAVKTRRGKVAPPESVQVPKRYQTKSSTTTNGNLDEASAHQETRVGRAAISSSTHVTPSDVVLLSRSAALRHSHHSVTESDAQRRAATRIPASNSRKPSTKLGPAPTKFPETTAASSRSRTTVSNRGRKVATSMLSRKYSQAMEQLDENSSSPSMSSISSLSSEENDVTDPDYVSESSDGKPSHAPLEKESFESEPPPPASDAEEEEEEPPLATAPPAMRRQAKIARMAPSPGKGKLRTKRCYTPPPTEGSEWTSPPRRAAAIAALPHLVESPPSKVKKPAKNRVTPAPILAASAIFRSCGFVVTKVDVANDEVPEDEEFDLKSVIRVTRDSVENQIRSGGGMIFPDFSALLSTSDGCRRRVRAGDAGLTSAQRYAAGTVERVYLIASAPKKTVKYLLALALGVPRVSAAWVGECCIENTLLDIEPFTLSNGFSTTLNAHCGSFSVSSGVFEGLKIGVSGDKEWKRSYAAVLRAGGAVAVEDVDSLAKASSRAKRKPAAAPAPAACDVVVTPELPLSAESRRAPRKMPGQEPCAPPVVSKEWVNECLITQRLHSVERFLVGPRAEAAGEGRLRGYPDGPFC